MRCLGVHESLAKLEEDAAASRLLVQCSVQAISLDGDADSPVWQRSSNGDLSQSLSGAAQQDDVAGREAGGQHRLVGIERAQGVQTIGGYGEIRADIFRGPGVRLVDDGLDPGAVQRHGRNCTGNTAADDQGFGHDPAPIRAV